MNFQGLFLSPPQNRFAGASWRKQGVQFSRPRSEGSSLAWRALQNVPRASQSGSAPKYKRASCTLVPRWAMGCRPCRQHLRVLSCTPMNLHSFFLSIPQAGETHTSQLPQGHQAHGHNFLASSFVPPLRRKIQGPSSGVVKGGPFSGAWGARDPEGGYTLPAYLYPYPREAAESSWDRVGLHHHPLWDPPHNVQVPAPGSVWSCKGELAWGLRQGGVGT